MVEVIISMYRQQHLRTIVPRARPAPHCRLSLTASFHSHCSSSILKVSWRCFNLLEFTGNYSATSNNTKLVHWPLMGGLLHLVQRGRDWAGPQPAGVYSLRHPLTSSPGWRNAYRIAGVYSLRHPMHFVTRVTKCRIVFRVYYSVYNCFTSKASRRYHNYVERLQHLKLYCCKSDT